MTSPYDEALQTLRRLARSDVRPVAPAEDHPATMSLPPRSSSLPAWTEQSFRHLVEGLPDAVVVIDDTGAIVLVNRQTEVLFGYSRDELVGEAIEVLVPERSRQAHVALRDGFLAAPRTRPLGAGMELFGRRKDGSEFPVEISLSPVRGGPRLLVTAVIRDVGERKRSEAKFRTLVENIPAVTFIAPLDDSSPELYVSPQIERLLGFSQREWVEDPVLWHRQLHPDDRDRWNRHFAPTCSSGEPFRASYRFLAKDGRTVWVHGSANVVRDEHDQLLFLQGVAFDITAIKEAEVALREQAQLATLRADISAAVTQADSLRGMLARCAEALARDLEDTEAYIWMAEEGRLTPVAGAARFPLSIDGRLLGELVVSSRGPLSPAALQTLEQIASQVALGIKRRQTEDELLRMNAELERRVRERTEELTRSLAEAREKSEELRKYSYHATHDAKEPLRTVLAQTQRVTQALRLEVMRGEIGEAISGTTNLEDMLARCVAALTLALKGPAAVWLFNDGEPKLAAGPGVGRSEACLIAASRVPLRIATPPCAGYPLLHGGSLLGVLTLFPPTPVSKETHETLEPIAGQVALGVARRLADGSPEGAERFARALDGAREETQMLRQAFHRDAADRLGKVVGAVGRMEVLLQRLKDYSDVQLDARPEPVDCGEAVSRARASLEGAITEAEAVVEVVGDGLPTIVGDRQHLELLFQNLIGNAIKYRSPDRPLHVEVGASRHADGWLLWVRDNGEGIEPKYWRKIFGIAERLDPRKGGWGYGLAICEKTVTRHGGRIWVASEPGQGSTFYFTLPATGG